jgi:flagellar secretion chaperone FliS
MTDPARAYRESAVRGASPVGLIVILYEEIIHSMRKAQRALQSGNIEERTRALNHALAVVGHLQGVLNFEKGGQVARDLSIFYDFVRTKILDANVRTDSVAIEWIVAECSTIKQAWEAVDMRISGEQGRADAEEEIPALAISGAGRPKLVPALRGARAHTL